MPRNRSRGELVAVSSLALATALASGVIVAHAQSFQGTGEVVAGSASIFATGSSTDITVSSPNAVINWTPFDDANGGGPIAFQPQGTTTTFTNNSSAVSDFAVLNRILPADPTRAIQFDGTVISQLQTGSGTVRGGTVFFYSPGGILVGPHAVFDVGNLGLTTSDLPFDPQSGAFSTNGVFSFQQSQAGSLIDIAQGAQISVGAAGPDNNSYLVMVAPSITQAGAIDVNGSAALVAADAATIEFSPSGLFSIRVNQGTSASGTVLASSGSIGGAAGSSSTFVHRIYMVAVPRNDAITMAITGANSLGFDIAGAADVVGNTVVLSAGYDVQGGVIDSAASAGGGSGKTDLLIGGPITATSAVDAKSTGVASVSVNAGESATFASDLTLQGALLPAGSPGIAAQVQVAGSGSSLNVAGNLSVVSIDTASIRGTGVNDLSGATVTVDGGSLSVGNTLTVRADRAGLVDSPQTTAGSATLFATNNAQVSIGSGLQLSANGTGSSPSSAAAAGNGQGGVAQLSYGNGASVSAGYIDIAAEGDGGEISSGYAGGNGLGGRASIDAFTGGGALTVGGSVRIFAGGTGTFGSDCISCTIEGGSGTGGTAAFSVSGGQAHTVSIGSDLTIAANGLGGDAATGNAGSGTGGTARLSTSGPAITFDVSGSTLVTTDASGGESLGTSTSGAGEGGLAQVINNGAALSSGAFTVSASAQGGRNISGGFGGAATGGDAQIRIGTGGGSITSGAVNITAIADAGGAGEGYVGIGGDGQGGAATLDIVAGNVDFDSLIADATGNGGPGAEGAGDGAGGLAAIRATGGTVTIGGDVSILSLGRGGVADSGGLGTGGEALISAEGGTLTFGGSDGLVTIDASGTGGYGHVSSGSGTGGYAHTTANNGTIAYNFGLVLDASGRGGNGIDGVGGNGGDGGIGTGGTVLLDAQSSNLGPSSITGTNFTLVAGGSGGRGGAGANVSVPAGVLTPGAGGGGGSGTGGTIVVNTGVGNGSFTPDVLTVDASGYGGLGGNGGDGDSINGPAGGNGGAGGAGTGGNVQFDSNGALGSGTPSGKLLAGSLSVSATGSGGAAGAGGAGTSAGTSGNGGSGTGGVITLKADRGGSLFQVDGNTVLLTTGTGASGSGTAIGGAGTGGSIVLVSQGATNGNQIKLASLYADSGGVGGNSLTGDGGTGTGGSVQLLVRSGLVLSASTMTLRGAGFGGSADGAYTGGKAYGGNVNVEAHTGSTLVVTGGITLDTGAVGGDNISLGGSGGDAAGGTSALRSVGGAITIGAEAVVGANAFGGTGYQFDAAGHGGAASAGAASISAGSGQELGNGGSIDISGPASVTSYASGGAGGAGGNATSGAAGVYARNGSVVINTLLVDTRALGGAGGYGGAGGSANAGAATISAQNAIAGIGRINLTSATVLADGIGGAGGDAPGDTGPTGVGGNGGSGVGGNVLVLGSAGNGQLTVGSLFASGNGTGGVGGIGDYNDFSTGGPGGSGGNGTGGYLQIGTESGIDTGSLNIGFAQFGSVSAAANGSGGNGGAGGVGSQGNGAGGNGGNGTGGSAVLLVRGSNVTLTANGSFDASAYGGNGGNGGTQGNGGNAAADGAAMLVTSRYLVDAQRGSVNAQNLTFTATASQGLGAVDGTASFLGQPLSLDVRNSDVTAQSISMTATGPAQTGVLPSKISIVNGNVSLTNGFQFITPGEISVALDGSRLTADHARLEAGNWVESGVAVTTPGSIEAVNALIVSSQGDIIGDVSFKAGSGIQVNASGLIRLFDLDATGDLDVSAGGTISLRNLAATGLVSVVGNGAVALGSVDANNAVSISSTGTLGISGSVTGVDRVALVSSGALTAHDVTVLGSSNPSSLRELVVQSDAAVTLGNTTAGSTRLFGAGTLNVGTLTGTDIALLGGGDIALGGATASGRLLLADYAMASAGGSPRGASYNYDALFTASPVRASGAITASGPLAAASLTATTTKALQLGAIQTTAANGMLVLDAGGAVTLGQVTAAGTATITSGGILSASSVAAGGDLALTATGDVTTASSTSPGLAGAVQAAGAVAITSSGGNITLGNVSATAGAINLAATGALASGDLTGSGGVRATAGTTAIVGNVATASGDITLSASGALTAATLLAGQGAITLDTSSTADVGAVTAYGPIVANIGSNARFASLSSQNAGVQVLSGGNLSSGQVSASTDIALVASGDLSLSDIVGRDMALLASGNVVVNAVVSGSTMIGSSSMLAAGTRAGNIDVSTLTSAAPVRVGGSIVMAKASGGRFSAASTGKAELGQIDMSQSIAVDSGGSAIINARWAAPSITVSSNSIAINTVASNGEPLRLDAGTTGAILLRSLSQDGVTLGDGFGVTEWTLSSAEWALIRSGSVTVRGLDGQAAVDLHIGNLAITGPMAGSTIDDPNGTVRFETVNDAGVISGGIRILGNVASRGFLSTNALEFATGRFELDAATGSLAIYGSGTTLAGTLRISADGIHVASGTILDKLQADIAYAGLEADLTQPASVQRPDGVLSAAAFDFTVGRSFYVQNTGTTDIPAGFLTAADGFRIGPAGSIPVKMIVNGAFLDGASVVTGKDAYAVFRQNHAQIGFFDAGSSLDGCLITVTACGVTTVDVPIEVVGPTVATQIQLLGQAGLGNTPAFDGGPGDFDPANAASDPTEEEQQAANEAAGAPIAPPTPLIDIRPLNPPSHIEEPVAGSGNPALVGSPVNENSAEGGL
ncbi:hypothetical protein [Novosphingobium olei]|uniref:Uncharacterized protein n=1 Tax=Novosphingobium olei TaxID=2728851 RepID=A0A7Y0BMX3_9SPHN|nr:hypothetical protein [Novosphingobium olei]NML93446.1 hypothetical protein [Novosphingobium olei]